MCVRTGTEELTEAVSSHTSKYTKAKLKYMKIHDGLVQEEDGSEGKIADSEGLNADILAKSTTLYVKFVEILEGYVNSFKNSKSFKILFQTTQPAHVVIVAAVLCVASALMPTQGKISAKESHSRLLSFIYLTSVAVHFGSQIWMTFVSGLSLYFALPRHNFGEVQRVLFPRYFAINAGLSLTTLLIYVKNHPVETWDKEITTQVTTIAISFFLELLIRLYFAPPLLQLMARKGLIEKAAGVGNEIGKHSPGALKHCPFYGKMHKAFRRVHMIIAIGNIITMACSVLHLHHIANKLCVL